ncbi:collagen-like protein [Bacillus thuringiensis]|uniref:collagen-like protein n=1 Tax=Bacillus thuringiensis TaxID=1428 RepID=UPI001482A23A|nr:collagen-like protein [Bacillus thuringiensis]
MSQPNIPNITPNISLTREESINLILASIALEELGLAHIINAEAEKIQYALGTLSGLSPAATLDEILAVNESVNKTIQSALKTQMLLQSKLDSVIQTPVLTGPTGPPGPTGPAGGPSGATGATGPQLTNSAQIFNTNGFTSTSNNQPVPLSTNGVITGTDITHTPGSADIMLAGGHTYLVTYMSNFTPPPNTTGVNELLLNGSPVPGSAYSNIGQVSGINDVNTTTAIITTPPGAPSTLNVAAFNTGTVYNASPVSPTIANVNVSIVELF